MAAKKTVPLFIPRDPASPEVKTMFFGLNGKFTLVPIGKQVEVDPAIAEIYYNSINAAQEAHEYAEEQSRIERETREKPLVMS